MSDTITIRITGGPDLVFRRPNDSELVQLARLHLTNDGSNNRVAETLWHFLGALVDPACIDSKSVQNVRDLAPAHERAQVDAASDGTIWLSILAQRYGSALFAHTIYGLFEVPTPQRILSGLRVPRGKNR